MAPHGLIPDEPHAEHTATYGTTNIPASVLAAPPPDRRDSARARRARGRGGGRPAQLVADDQRPAHTSIDE